MSEGLPPIAKPEYTQIGDRVVFIYKRRKPLEKREVPIGTEGTIIGYDRTQTIISYNRQHGGLTAGIYTTNGDIIVKWDNGDTSIVSYDKLAFIVPHDKLDFLSVQLNDIRAEQFDYHAAFTSYARIADLPELLYMEGMVVELKKYQEMVEILAIDYNCIPTHRLFDPSCCSKTRSKEIYYVRPYTRPSTGLYTVSQKSLERQCKLVSADDICRTLQLGNYYYWKTKHTNRMAFNSREEENLFYVSVGEAYFLTNPTSFKEGVSRRVWKREDAIEAVIHGQADQFHNWSSNDKESAGVLLIRYRDPERLPESVQQRLIDSRNQLIKFGHLLGSETIQS